MPSSKRVREAIGVTSVPLSKRPLYRAVCRSPGPDLSKVVFSAGNSSALHEALAHPETSLTIL